MPVAWSAALGIAAVSVGASWVLGPERRFLHGVGGARDLPSQAGLVPRAKARSVLSAFHRDVLSPFRHEALRTVNADLDTNQQRRQPDRHLPTHNKPAYWLDDKSYQYAFASQWKLILKRRSEPRSSLYCVSLSKNTKVYANIQVDDY